MTQILGSEQQQDYLQFDNATIKEIYSYVTMLVNSRYKEPIKTLQARHHGYSSEDFIQEVMLIILKESKAKKFPTINHLKSFIKLTAEFHYLKEKRKYYFTKQRGSYSEVSIFDSTTNVDDGSSKLIAETLTYDKNEHEHIAELLDLQSLLKKNLYVVYDWRQLLEVCTVHELKNYKTGYALSVANLLKVLQEYGAKDACKHFKEVGFFMTRKILDDISQKLIQYIKDNKIIEVTVERPAYIDRHKTREERFKYITDAQKTCSCGYRYTEDMENRVYWQCPICGKIHDKLNLAKQKLALLSL